jgi:flagellar assembly factor FliW
LLKFDTKHFGVLEIPKGNIITFNYGLFGFENLRTFFFLENRDNENFKWLQSGDNKDVCFLIVNPVTFMFDYTLEINDDVVDELKIKEPEDVIIYSLVVVPKDSSKISANLCGPIVVKVNTMLGKQVVSINSKHKVKHFILEELKKNSEKLIAAESEKTKNQVTTDSKIENDKEVVNASSNKKI